MAYTPRDTKDWKTAKAVLPFAPRILLHGLPGTGKTSIGFSDDKPTHYYPCHDESSVAELLGHFVPVGDRFIWLNGPGLDAAVKGERLVLDEVDQASGSVLSVLRALLNDRSVARFTIPDPKLAALSDEELADAILQGEGLTTVTPAEGFQVIASMNGEPEDLDAPLLDRFDAIVRVDTPNPDAIMALPEDLREAANTTASQKDDDRRIGLRRWKSFASLRENVGEETAGRAVFGARYGDVLDALKMSRDTTPPTTDDTEVEVAPEVPADAPMPARDPNNPAAQPTAYFLKTGARGRPPRAECVAHGYMTGKTGVEDANGLSCVRCGTLVAPPGTYRARVMDRTTGKWSNRGE